MNELEIGKVYQIDYDSFRNPTPYLVMVQGKDKHQTIGIVPTETGAFLLTLNGVDARYDEAYKPSTLLVESAYHFAEQLRQTNNPYVNDDCDNLWYAEILNALNKLYGRP